MLKAALKTLPSQVSIPQAVSTIAIQANRTDYAANHGGSFNTASGKYYCNGGYKEGAMTKSLVFQYRKR